jgi:AcrR family transcriptional regulator
MRKKAEKKAGPTRASKRPAKAPERSAGDARQRILAVAGRMLRDVGPDGLRLQEIAREVGVSHPAILHHFGSREGLVHAVVDRAGASLEADIVASLSAGEGEVDPAALVERVFRTFSDNGHARLIAWLSLTGSSEYHAASKLGEIAQLVHALRKKKLDESGLPCPPFEDSAFVVMLSCFALLGDAICGKTVREAITLGKKDPTGERFRRWLADRLVEHLDRQSTE